MGRAGQVRMKKSAGRSIIPKDSVHQCNFERVECGEERKVEEECRGGVECRGGGRREEGGRERVREWLDVHQFIRSAEKNSAHCSRAKKIYGQSAQR